MEDVIDFLFVILVQSTLDAGILAKDYLTFPAFLCWLLNLLAIETLQVCYFLKLHPFGLASLLKDKLLIVANFAGIVYFAARGLDVTYIDAEVQFR